MGIFSRKSRSPSKEEENQAFRLKYEQFRELLERNNEVLETISLLSDIRERDQWISLGRLRSLVTQTAVNVYRLVENLNLIADGQYKTLNQVFAGLQEKIIALLEPHPQRGDGPLGLDLAEVSAGLTSELGAKAANLGDVAAIDGVRVPRGVAISIHSYNLFLEYNGLFKRINKELLVVDPEDSTGLEAISHRLRELIMAAELPPELEEFLNEAYRRMLGPDGKPASVVMRSSAVGEDDPAASFAGLYRSIINPAPEALAESYKKVVASKFSPRVLTYFMQKGIYHDLCPMAVLMMELVPAEAGGVMFTTEGDGDKEALLISGVWGLGKLAVEGTVTPDIFRVSRTEPPAVLERVAGDKPFRLDPQPGGGVTETPVPRDLRRAPCLNDDQVIELARLGLMLEARFGEPQDIEWCLGQQGHIHIVQCRPLAKRPAESGWSVYYPWEKMSAEEPLVSGLQVGSAGAAAGRAVVMESHPDTRELEPGTLALVKNTSPDLVNILPRVAGVLAERGNTSGHLAIIAREFGVPLAVGLPADRVKALTGWDQVSLDAYTGSVYGGRVEPLVKFAERMQSQALEVPLSPLRRLLDEVLQYVTPLNLTNPRDPSFRPQSIQTIHDIIRFAHEKAINAMFEINDSRLVSRGKVVRLNSEVPLDIYVINLGRGIAEGAKAKKVKPEEITCIPMRALYQGMTTPGVRWAGHIPIDFRGFMSVFANTMFDGSKYERKLGDRSYAIISRHYVNFSSRLGYHFSIVDAYVGPEVNQNYISFRFKGGAARLDKRTRRAQFLGEVLRRFDFWVDQKADLINARIKRLPRAESEEKLGMLGRLMGCSRQLDVTMYNQDVVDRYVDLFMQGDYSMGYADQSAAQGGGGR